jgi:hypothetical protein
LDHVFGGLVLAIPSAYIVFMTGEPNLAVAAF